MDVLGWILVVAGGGLFLVALVRTVRANPSTTLPYYAPPPTTPPGTVAMRLGGAALLVVGGVVLVPVLGIGSILLVVAGPLVAAGVIAFHNARVASRR